MNREQRLIAWIITKLVARVAGEEHACLIGKCDHSKRVQCCDQILGDFEEEDKVYTSTLDKEKVRDAAKRGYGSAMSGLTTEDDDA